MKTLILSLLILSNSFVLAEQTVSIQVMGVSFSTPDRFNYSHADQMFQTFKGEEGEIKVHFTETLVKTPEEALKTSIARSQKDPKSYQILEQSSVTTRSGIAGEKGDFGKKNGEEIYVAVARHYFPVPNGRIACICVSGKGKENQKKLEAMVLETFRWTEKNIRSNHVSQPTRFARGC